MGLLAQTALNSVVQILVFAAVPCVWWLATARSSCAFGSYVGLRGVDAPSRRHVAVWSAATAAAFVLVSVAVLLALGTVRSATSAFAGRGITALPAVVVYAVFNTSLPEELLFRGFVLKRLQASFGFTVANAAQATLFGLLHGVMFASVVGVPKALLVIAFTGAIAWCMGYVNERLAGGSILPSWMMHAAANVFSGLVSAL